MQKLFDRGLFLLRLLKARGWKAVLHEIQEAESGHSLILSKEPPVVVVTAGRNRMPLHQRFGNDPLVLGVCFFWTVTPADVESQAALVKEARARHPRHRTVFLCNEAQDVVALEKAGLDAIFVNHNCFVDERLFSPVSDSNKRFNAVHNGVMSPYKRHELASEVGSLLLITYRWHGSAQDGYENKVRHTLPNAWWANDELKGGGKFTPAELPALYSSASVGLCLSAAEGAMFASMEYMLCGLPVVSTPSTGGRDAFFDPRYTRVVEPDARRVAEAVHELIRLELDPADIRKAALEKMREHRGRLEAWMREAGSAIECPQAPGSHGAFEFRKYRDIAKLVRSA